MQECDKWKTLQKHFAYKFHIPAGSVTIKTVERLIREHNMDEALIKQIKSVFDDCEAVRYASIRFEKSKMSESYAQAEEIIDIFERKWWWKIVKKFLSYFSR